jgi:hypothetical protein
MVIIVPKELIAKKTDEPFTFAFGQNEAEALQQQDRAFLHPVISTTTAHPGSGYERQDGESPPPLSTFGLNKTPTFRQNKKTLTVTQSRKKSTTARRIHSPRLNVSSYKRHNEDVGVS